VLASSPPSPTLIQRMGRLAAVGPFWLWLLLVMVIGGIVGLGSFTFAYARGASYLSDNPEACLNCHVMREVYDGWNHGSHKAVAVCNDCHTPHTFPEKYLIKGLNGWNHGFAFTTGDFPDPIRITPMNYQVAQENCLYCHGDLVAAISHQNSESPTDCISCHAGVGHGR
jgi:cytochrome c nitrite reductase small subunit